MRYNLQNKIQRDKPPENKKEVRTQVSYTTHKIIYYYLFGGFASLILDP